MKRRKLKLKATSMNLDVDTDRLIAQLANRLALARVQVIRLAIRGFAETHGMKLP